MSCNYRVDISKITLFNIQDILGKNAFLRFEILTCNGMEQFSTNSFTVKDNQ